MAKYKLWISPGASSLPAHIAMRAAGIDIELVVVDVTKHGFTEEHRRINPKGRVPVLELGDGSILTESVAIGTYASQLAPEKHLLGKTPLEVARSYEWLNWLSGTVHEHGFGAAFNPKNYSDNEDAWDGIQKKNKEFIIKCFGIIEEKIQGVHAVGDAFTFADTFLLAIYRWGYLLGWDMTGLYPKWTKLVHEVVKQDSVKEAVEKEGIPMIEDNRIPPAGIKE